MPHSPKKDLIGIFTSFVTVGSSSAHAHAHLVSDSNNLKVNVTPFEVGSHTGYINSDNKKYIHALHKFCKKNIKLKLFMQNMSAISVMSSYYIFNCRNFENWEDMEPIQPPFKHQWTLHIFIQEETTMFTCRKICETSIENHINLSMRLNCLLHYVVYVPIITNKDEPISLPKFIAFIFVPHLR